MNETLQQAVYTALTGDATLVGLVQGIYDDPPDASDPGAGAAFPYVTIGDDVIGAWGTDDWSGGDAVIRVHVWSRYNGRKEAKNILDRVRTVLDRSTLALAGYQNVTTDFLQSFVLRDPDGETRHGVGEFRVLICA